jgi:hypothetical protein
MVVTQVSGQVMELFIPLAPCHICEVIGHKLIICLEFNEMHNRFKDKGSKIAKNKHVDVKVTTTCLQI